MALAVVETYADNMQAHIAKGLLEAHGIEAETYRSTVTKMILIN